MKIRELDDLIGRMLGDGPKTATAIHACSVQSDLTLHDVESGLRIWVRNGWAKEFGTGMFAAMRVELACEVCSRMDCGINHTEELAESA